MEYFHTPVMLAEVLAALDPERGGRYVDGTIGGGGHTKAILERVGPRGRVLGLDRDPESIGRLEKVMSPAAPNLILRQANFAQVNVVLDELGWEVADGMLLDLGLSSFQIDRSGRGFSFQKAEPLDMRMDPAHGEPASTLVNRLPEKELADLIYRFGEDRASRRIARAIVRARPLERSDQLAEVIRRASGRSAGRARIHPATRTFQALRVAVNKELDNLAEFLNRAPELVRPGGRLVVISFNSLEDRLVKISMSRLKGRSDRDDAQPVLKALYKKPLRPSPEEIAANPRARSAKLRAAERV